MQAIGKAVGDAQPNDASDVTLIQAALVKIARPAAKGRPVGPYLSSYNGIFGKGITEAITAFQNDHKLSGAQVTGGRVSPGDGTFQTLAAALPRDVADLRVLPRARTAYIAAPQADLVNRLSEAGGKLFTAAFGLKVSATIRRMFTETGIVLAVDPDGDHRTFQKQYALRTSGRGVTHAGPGESNHNFGGAVDLGFKGLRWLKPDGTVVQEAAWWLAGMPESNQQAFWDKLRSTGIACGAFNGPLGDRPHLQNWNDAGVSMVSRLAVLLTRSGSMKWTAAHGVYSCDLGFGGALVPVGSAVQIWEQRAMVDAAAIHRLRTAQHTHGATPRSSSTGPAQRPGPAPHGPGLLGNRLPAAGPGTPPHPASASHRPGVPGSRPIANDAAEVAAMRQALRQQFEVAEAHWRDWTAR